MLAAKSGNLNCLKISTFKMNESSTMSMFFRSMLISRFG